MNAGARVITGVGVTVAVGSGVGVAVAAGVGVTVGTLSKASIAAFFCCSF